MAKWIKIWKNKTLKFFFTNSKDISAHIFLSKQINNDYVQFSFKFSFINLNICHGYGRVLTTNNNLMLKLTRIKVLHH